MLVLAFDTAMAACSAAVIRVHGTDVSVCAARFERRTRGHAEVLAPMIADVMEEAGLGYADLDRIGVTTGPGTFTGVRIGVAMARGMSVASGLSVVGITTLEAVAAGEAGRAGGSGRNIACIFDARRSEVYVQCFSPGLEALTEPQALTYEAAKELLAPFDPAPVGTGAGLVFPHVPDTDATPENRSLPDAVLVAGRAALRPLPEEPVTPLYLRAPDAKLPAAR